MRVFWAMIGLLVVITAGFAYVGRDTAPDADGSTVRTILRDALPPVSIDVSPVEADEGAPAEAPAPDADNEPAPEDVEPEPSPEPAVVAEKVPADEVLTPSPAEESPAPAADEAEHKKPAEEPDETHITGDREAALRFAAALAGRAPKPEPKAEAQTEPEPEAEATEPEAAPKAEPIADPENGEQAEPDAIVAEPTKAETDANPEPAAEESASDVMPSPAPASAAARFVLRGKGTKKDPYLITWEHLISAAQTYKPKEGMTEIPPYVQKLHDSRVRITGYFAFPMVSGDIEEMLIMLNQWDGCCIGVPPSPYDSIEVRLSAPTGVERIRFSPYGVVEGVLKVDPYLVNGWLVGLYLMEDATMKVPL